MCPNDDSYTSGSDRKEHLQGISASPGPELPAEPRQLMKANTPFKFSDTNPKTRGWRPLHELCLCVGIHVRERLREGIYLSDILLPLCDFPVRQDIVGDELKVCDKKEPRHLTGQWLQLRCALWLTCFIKYWLHLSLRWKKKKGLPNKRSLYLVSRKTLLDKHFSFIPLLSVTGANCWPEQKNKIFPLLPRIFLLCKMIKDTFSPPMFSPVHQHNFITFCIWKQQMCFNSDHLNSRTPTFCQKLLFPMMAPEQVIHLRLAPLLRTFIV